MKKDYPKGVLEIRDSGPRKFADRYCVVYEDYEGSYRSSVSMSADPFWPQGICQHGAATPGIHLGRLIRFAELPTDCQKVVHRDLGNTD